MKSAVLFVILVCSGCLAQQQRQQEQQQEERAPSLRLVRAPQGHLQYSDPDGLKVSWKLYTPTYVPWNSNVDSSNQQRVQRAESDTVQPLGFQSGLIRPVPAPTPAPQPEKPDKVVEPVPIQYKPYAMVPMHIKQLLATMYQPQVPYVDPGVYIYQAQLKQQQEELEKQQQQRKAEAEPTLPQYYPQPQQQRQPEPERESNVPQYYPQPRYEQYSPKYYPKKYPAKTKLGYVHYKEDQPTTAASDSELQFGAVLESRYRQQQQQQQQQQQRKDEEQQQQQQPKRQNEDAVMPREIYQLLNLQAQTPYHVIANGIVYKPKTLFVPKPLEDDGKGPYKYRSKVYWMKDLEEDQQNKGRGQPRDFENTE